MSDPADSYTTPTDVLVKAMENADEMDCVIVIYRTKNMPDGHNHSAWHMSDKLEIEKAIGLIEHVKYAIQMDNYHVVRDIEELLT